MKFLMGILAVILANWFFGATVATVVLSALLLLLYMRADERRIDHELHQIKTSALQAKKNAEAAESPEHFDITLESDEDDLMMS